MLQRRRVANDLFKHRRLDDLFAESDVLFSYFFFRPFAILDISPYATPSCYVSPLIFDRSEADKKTAKLPVMSQQPSLVLKRSALAKSLLSFTDKMFTILRMNEIKSRPWPCRSGFRPTRIGSPHGGAEILEPHLVNVERASIGSKDTNVLRGQIQNLSKLCLLFADFFFRNFALLDFYTRAEPLDDLSRFVAQWFFTMKEPAIFTVSPAHPRLGKEGFP